MYKKFSLLIISMIYDESTRTAVDFYGGNVILYPVNSKIYEGKTDFQDVYILDTKSFGKMLVLDGDMQSCQSDEHLYHEALVQPAMHLHPGAKSVLVLGGGEGATLREALKHGVDRVVMVDIDERLVEICKQHLPEWHAGCFSDKRAELLYTDAFRYVEDCKEKFDVIIIDVTDPSSSIAKHVFSEKFYDSLKEIMEKGAICAFQAGDFMKPDIYNKILEQMRKCFGFAYPYKNFIPSFYTEWGFILASTEKTDTDNLRAFPVKNRFYTGVSHRSMFSVDK